MTRLPITGSDDNTWGTILNDFLSVVHNSDGTIRGGVIGNDQVLDNTLAESKLSPAVQAKLNAVSGVTSVAGKTGAVTLTSSDVGLGSVDDTSDVSKNSAVATLTNKTISGASNTLSNIAQSSVTNLTADLSGKAPTASPVLTGTPTAPTATAGTNTTQLATTAFVTTAVSSAAVPDATASTKGKVQLADSSDVAAASGSDVLTAGLIPASQGVTGIAKVQFIAHGGTVMGSPGPYTIIIEAGP